MRRPLIIKWKHICKLACKDTHADCSASLCWRQRSAKRHLEKGDARKEYTSGFSASFKFCYLPLISSKIRRCITPWKPFAQKARVAKRRESVRKNWVLFSLERDRAAARIKSRRHRAYHEEQTLCGICVVRRCRLKFIPKRNGFYKPHPEQHTHLPSLYKKQTIVKQRLLL